MTARDFLSPDLLNGLEGIEHGLRRRRSLGRVGAIGLLVLVTFQLSLGILSVVANVSWATLVAQWYLIVPSLVVASALVLFVAARYWIKESRAPFRYTCRIGKFDAVSPSPEAALPWLRHDLAELLNDRIGRLSFLDEEPENPEQQEAHLHIAGEYLLRKERADHWVIEITPRVRVGGKTASGNLAHPVRYELPEFTEAAPPHELLDREHYDKILERVYFSVATRLYKRIQEDVERKIALLPTRYLRATAYLHEAEDYAQSNTLDAYDDAQELFEKARLLYDPSSRPLPTGRLRRLGARGRIPARWLVAACRKVLSHVVLHFAKREVMLARTELGLANTLVARRALAQLSGRRVNQIFIARAIAERARDRLDRLTNTIGYPKAAESLFDARVTLALVLHYLGSDERADEELKSARASLPDHAEQNASYLFAAALLEPRTTFALSLLRRAIEINPRFEIAQFERALRTEMLWQFRPGLERTVAETVIREYTKVVRINPGNIQAWSSLGHTRWLLARTDRELEEAEADFLRGLEYKQIKRETFVAGLRYSLARVTAERGRFADAYQHYVASTTASVGEGIAHRSWAEQHNTVVRNEAMLSRFDRYVAAFERQRHSERATDVEDRIRRSVKAFVENDYGEACLNFYERTGKSEYLDKARKAYEAARKTNPTYVIPAYNLCLLSRLIGDYEAAETYIQAVRRREPKWPEAILEEMMVDTRNSQRPLAKRRDQLEDEIETTRDLLADLEERAKALDKSKLKGEYGEAVRIRLSPSESGLGADATEIVAAGSAPYELEGEISRLENQLKRLRKERQEVEQKLVDSAREVRDSVRNLVPHEWLWRRGDDDSWAFQWRALRSSPRTGHRWERDFGDLHVRALETWAVTRTLSKVDQTEGGKLGWGRRRTDDLLRHLEKHFWPDREEALSARFRLHAEPAVADRLARLAARLLAFDPANYRLLLSADERLPAVGGSQAETKRKAFMDALAQRDVAPPVLAWLGERFERLEAYDCALDAYGKAAEAKRLGADQATVRLGTARAEWGMGNYAAAVASLEGLEPADGVRWWTAFARALVERGQIAGPTRAGGRDDAAPSIDASSGLPGIAALGKLFTEPTREAPATDDASHHPEAATEGYPQLVAWLKRQHAGAVLRHDAEGAGDAAEALLALAAARYETTAPNRTAAPPDVSATTADLDLSRSSTVVPLIRRFAVEAHPQVFENRGEDRFRTFVRRQLPELHAKIEKDTGVPTPNMAIASSSEIGKNEFRVLANEIPVVTRTVAEDEGYEPILAAIDTVVREKLGAVFGVDDVVRALRSLRGDDAGLVEQVLVDDTAKLQLLTTIRLMLRRRVRVDLKELLDELRRELLDTEGIVDAILRRRGEVNGDRPAPGIAARLAGPSWLVERT